MHHLPTSAFKVREGVKRELIRLCWTPTDHMAVDALTKNLGSAKFHRFQRVLLNLPPSREVRRLVTHQLIGGFA